MSYKVIMQEKTNYLYHYTNLSALASILKNGTIRFFPLDTMDDMDDGKTSDFSYARKYVFCSSWTDISEESIPLWSMYTNEMKGVRIRLPINPFEEYIWDNDVFIGKDNHKEPYFISQNDAFGDNYTVAALFKNMFLNKVEYTNNYDMLFPKIKTEEKKDIRIYMKDVGQYKRKAWEFQREYRYRLVVFPKRLDFRDMSNSIKDLYDRMQAGYPLQINHIDLRIKKEYLSNIEILGGPKMTEGDKILLQELVKQFCPNATLKYSDLKIR